MITAFLIIITLTAVVMHTVLVDSFLLGGRGGILPTPWNNNIIKKIHVRAKDDKLGDEGDSSPPITSSGVPILIGESTGQDVNFYVSNMVKFNDGESNELAETRLKISAVEFCLDGLTLPGLSTTSPELDERSAKFKLYVRIYMKYDDAGRKEILLKLLGVLEKELATLLVQQPVVRNQRGKETAISKDSARRVASFSAVWAAIVNDGVIKNSTDQRLWSLPGGVNWIGNVNVLFNRPCYDEITTAISSLTYALIIGTPGIGKTLFLQIFLAHLAGCAKKAGRAIPTIHYVYKTDDVVVKLSFLPDGSVIDITGIGRGGIIPAEYLLSDSVDLSDPYGSVLNLEVASEYKRNYKNFEKRIAERGGIGGRTITMPLWSQTEFDSIRPATMDERLAKYLFRVFGGSARNFMASEYVESDVLPIVEDTMNFVFQYDEFDKLFPYEWSNTIRRISLQLMSEDDALPANPSNFNSMLQHLPTGRKRIWASNFMGLLAGAIHKDSSSAVTDLLRRLISSSGEAYLFESLGHMKLMNSKVPFTLKPLLNPLPDDKPVFPSAEFNLTPVLFDAVADIASLPDGTYGLPSISNFPLVDAIVQPNTLILFTISPTRHTGSVTTLREICAGLREKDLTKVRIVFVIPIDNVATFRGHEDLLVDGIAIPQYICLDDPSVVNEKKLMTTNEIRMWLDRNKKTNSYRLFMSDFRDNLESKGQEIPAGTFQSQVSKAWKGLSDKDKEEWKRRASEMNLENA